MGTKTTGAEWKRYYSDTSAWPDGAWHDDEIITVNGVDAEDIDLNEIEDSAVVVVSGGVYLTGTHADDNAPSLETHFKRWRKAQSTTFLAVEVPNEKLEAVLQAIQQAGGNVKK